MIIIYTFLYKFLTNESQQGEEDRAEIILFRISTFHAIVFP